MFVIPVSFAKHQKQRTTGISKRAYELYILNSTNLLVHLVPAVEDGPGNLDKEVTSHDNLQVVFRLSLLFFLVV